MPGEKGKFKWLFGPPDFFSILVFALAFSIASCEWNLTDLNKNVVLEETRGTLILDLWNGIVFI